MFCRRPEFVCSGGNVTLMIIARTDHNSSLFRKCARSAGRIMKQTGDIGPIVCLPFVRSFVRSLVVVMIAASLSATRCV